MPRKLRLEYPGAIYHVANRGDRREDIFKDDLDRAGFLSTLEEACQKTEWQVLAYCLMRNHFHLVIETPQPNLVAGMKWLLGVYMEQRRRQEDGVLFEVVRRGWCLGSEEFRQELLAGAVERVGASHDGADRRETGQEKAGRMVREELRREGWKEEDLPGMRKGDKVKLRLARRLRRETTMSLKWIARRLHMGSWTYVSNLLHEKREH
jgi:REP element-mobilizing transposase RayT